MTDALALGQATSLSNLAFRQGLCGQVLSVDCGNGVVNAVVASKCISGTKCGVDLIGQTWKKATGNLTSGIAQCRVALTKINPIRGSAPLCFFRPNTSTNNPHYASIGLFNTGGLIPSSASLANIAGLRTNADDGYFSFHSDQPFSKDANITFNFENGLPISIPFSSCSSAGDVKHF